MMIYLIAYRRFGPFLNLYMLVYTVYLSKYHDSALDSTLLSSISSSNLLTPQPAMAVSSSHPFLTRVQSIPSPIPRLPLPVHWCRRENIGSTRFAGANSLGQRRNETPAFSFRPSLGRRGSLEGWKGEGVKGGTLHGVHDGCVGECIPS